MRNDLNRLRSRTLIGLRKGVNSNYVLSFGATLRERELEELLNGARELTTETIALIRELLGGQFEQVEISRVLQRIEATTTRVRDQIDSIRRGTFTQEHDQAAANFLQQIRDRTREMAQEYREVGRSRVREFLSHSQLCHYLRNLFRR